MPGSGRSPAGGHATHSSIRAWRIPGIEEPGGLQSIESQRVGHEWSDLTRDVEEVCKNSWSFARTDALMTQEGNRLLLGSEENTPVHFSSPRACCVIERPQSVHNDAICHPARGSSSRSLHLRCQSSQIMRRDGLGKSCGHCSGDKATRLCCFHARPSVS